MVGSSAERIAEAGHGRASDTAMEDHVASVKAALLLRRHRSTHSLLRVVGFFSPREDAAAQPRASTRSFSGVVAG